MSLSPKTTGANNPTIPLTPESYYDSMKVTAVPISTQLLPLPEVNKKPTLDVSLFGFEQSLSNLGIGQKGILIDKKTGGGKEVEVTYVTTSQRWPGWFVYQYEFKDKSGKVFWIDGESRYTLWDFYTKPEPIPVVPKVRKGGKKKSRKTRRKSRSSRK
jgi:hypothetical protein